MYRKVPVDLMEGTKRGSTLSLIAVAGMLTLFLLETSAYFRARVVTDLVLDRNRDPKVRINFNITMMDLKCEYVVVDVVSVLGTEQNVSSHVTKWHVDGAGVRQRYQGRNKEQHDIAMYDPAVQESMEDLLKDGEDAVSLDPETFRYALKTYQYLFVDWYASWCSHCRDLAPTWEILAELMVDVAEDILDAKGHDYSEEEYAHARKVEQPVVVAKIDCVFHQELCMEQQIMAYPTLRLFVDGKRWKGGDYRGSRTLVEMTDWLQQVEDAHKADEGSEANRTSLLAHKGKVDLHLNVLCQSVLANYSQRSVRVHSDPVQRPRSIPASVWQTTKQVNGRTRSGAKSSESITVGSTRNIPVVNSLDTC